MNYEELVEHCKEAGIPRSAALGLIAAAARNPRWAQRISEAAYHDMKSLGQAEALDCVVQGYLAGERVA